MEAMVFCFGIGMLFGGIIMAPLMYYLDKRWSWLLGKYKWIPINEKLPEDGTRVLFCDDDTIYYGPHHHNRWWDDTINDDVKDVIAWMPLPGLYKKEESK